MVKWLFVFALLVFNSSAAGQTVCPNCGRVTYSNGGQLDWLAQQKAGIAASGLIRGHVGGSIGGAAAEGCGWSSISARHAIAKCCFSGSPFSAKRGPYQTRLGTGVSRGADGVWYAVILVR